MIPYIPDDTDHKPVDPNPATEDGECKQMDEADKVEMDEVDKVEEEENEYDMPSKPTQVAATPETTVKGRPSRRRVWLDVISGKAVATADAPADNTRASLGVVYGNAAMNANPSTDKDRVVRIPMDVLKALMALEIAPYDINYKTVFVNLPHSSLYTIIDNICNKF